MTFILGLTGGIATGKSTVAAYLAEKGLPIVDADVGARKVVEPHSEGLQRIIKEFGEQILLDDGSLNRKRLGEIIFAQDEKRQLLNSLLHDLIQNWIYLETESLIKQGYPLIVWDVPLLYETHFETNCDAVMVVYVPEEVQLQRLMNRDQINLDKAEERIKSQMSIEEKREKADILIQNIGDIKDTYRQLDKWMKENTSLLEEPRK